MRAAARLTSLSAQVHAMRFRCTITNFIVKSRKCAVEQLQLLFCKQCYTRQHCCLYIVLGVEEDCCGFMAKQ